MNIRLYSSADGKLKKDKLRWLLTRNGEFSVKSLYAKLLNPMGSIAPKTKSFWQSLWNMDTSQRIKLFTWKCLQDTLPTRQKLGSHMDVETQCIFCKQVVESTYHLFFECDYATAV